MMTSSKILGNSGLHFVSGAVSSRDREAIIADLRATMGTEGLEIVRDLYQQRKAAVEKLEHILDQDILLPKEDVKAEKKLAQLSANENTSEKASIVLDVNAFYQQVIWHFFESSADIPAHKLVSKVQLGFSRCDENLILFIDGNTPYTHSSVEGDAYKTFHNKMAPFMPELLNSFINKISKGFHVRLVNPLEQVPCAIKGKVAMETPISGNKSKKEPPIHPVHAFKKATPRTWQEERDELIAHEAGIENSQKPELKVDTSLFAHKVVGYLFQASLKKSGQIVASEELISELSIGFTYSDGEFQLLINEQFAEEYCNKDDRDYQRFFIEMQSYISSVLDTFVSHASAGYKVRLITSTSQNKLHKK